MATERVKFVDAPGQKGDPERHFRFESGGALYDLKVCVENGSLESNVGIRERRIRYGGVNYEHVDTDMDGVWVYRAM